MKPETSLPDDPRNFWTIPYGLKTYGDLFTPRQLVALTTFSDLVAEAIERCRQDALAAWTRDDNLQEKPGNAAQQVDHGLPRKTRGWRDGIRAGRSGCIWDWVLADWPMHRTLYVSGDRVQTRRSISSAISYSHGLGLRRSQVYSLEPQATS